MNRLEYPPDIEVELTFLSPEEGGRESPAFSGYRPQFYCDGQNYDAAQYYIGTEKVLPGETTKAHLYFTYPEKQVGNLFPGKEFEVREGHRIIAKGVVTKILALENSAIRSTTSRS
jgi:translation elongation factor EF-Tu-like GTPase